MTSGLKPVLQPAADGQFKQCLRERLRLAREIAALRARFATAVQEYERVLRTLQLLAPRIGLSEQEVGHPTEPEWGPSALLTYADGYFLKAEQDRIDRLLHLMP
jgi:hypothetical protein